MKHCNAAPLLYCSAVQTNFGPANASTVVTAWAVPSVNASLAFPATACSVTTAHTTITCTVGAGAGAALSWRVVVEGQSNAVPQSSYAPPTLHNATWTDPGVTSAATVGGTALSITGVNLGPTIAFVSVSITLPAGEVVVPSSSCALVRPDVELVCTLPPGTGAIARVGVTVLGQGTWLTVTGLAYAAPVVTALSPSEWGTDLRAMTVTLAGSGFGLPTQSHLVVVSAWGLPGPYCGLSGLVPVTLITRNVNVRSDSELVFEAQYTGPHLVPAWQVSITVSGQALAGSGVVPVNTLPPSVPTMTFEVSPNATHYFLSLTGRNYGPAVSDGTCLDDVVVTVGGQPCTALSMPRVR